MARQLCWALLSVTVEFGLTAILRRGYLPSMYVCMYVLGRMTDSMPQACAARTRMYISAILQPGSAPALQF